MNANEQDLTGDGWFTVEIDGDWSGGADATPVTFHNYICPDANNNIRIATTSVARHKGKFSTSYYVLSKNDRRLCNIEVSYLKIDGVQFKNNCTYAYGGVESIYVYPGYTNFNFSNSIVYCLDTNANRQGFLLNGNNHTLENIIIYRIANSSSDVGINFNGDVNLYNCVIYGNWDYGTIRSGGAQTLKNCYAHTVSGISYNYNGTLTTCASSDATGSVGLQNISASTSSGTYFTNLSAGTEDFHIQSSSVLIGAGTDLSATFTTDIDGQTRPTGAGTWDIGADEYVAEANYSMGNYSSLPADDADLENIYTAQNITDVATNDTNRVSQGANSGDYAIHQYKNVVGKQTILDWDGQCSLAPASSPVYLQIYNRSGTPAWETLDSKSTGVADSDFTLTATINDTTNYRDGSGVICCRIYQRNI